MAFAHCVCLLYVPVLAVVHVIVIQIVDVLSYDTEDSSGWQPGVWSVNGTMEAFWTPVLRCHTLHMYLNQTLPVYSMGFLRLGSMGKANQSVLMV